MRNASVVTVPAKKVWGYDVNFGNPNNWEGGKLPCTNNRVILPSFSSVFLNVNASVRELMFARDAEFVLGSNVNLGLGGDLVLSSSNDCPPADVKFKDPQYVGWYSANAWQIGGIEQNEIMVPVPETERVPCYYDDVVFPQGSSFAVNVEGPSVLIRSLSLAGQNVNTTEFENFVSTPAGQHQFHNFAKLTIHNTSCSDSSGCLCGNNKQSIKSKVCKETKCLDIDCKDPIKPHGSCCYLCGSVVVVEYNEQFQFSSLLRIYNALMNKDDYKNIHGYMSKIKDGTNQAIFRDKTASHKAAALALEIETYIDEDIKNLRTLGITSVAIQVSQNWIHHALEQGQGLSVGSVIGIVFGFVFCVALTLTALYYYRKHTWVNLTFGRLYEDSKPEEPVAFSAATSSLKGFANPMYQEPVMGPLYEDTAMGPQVQISSEERANPVFTADDVEDDEDLMK